MAGALLPADQLEILVSRFRLDSSLLKRQDEFFFCFCFSLSYNWTNLGKNLNCGDILNGSVDVY